ncbi:MAG: hypothetical protein HUJ27_10055 [Rhodobacteraceae bacterium]|nr:hypothetical protein [Paracoccaceae bacterium]
MEETLLTIHFLSLAVGVGGGVASAVAAATAAGQEPPGKMAIGKVTSKVGDIGYAALILLWVTGLWLVFAEHGGFGALPGTFTAKMVGVLGLTGALTAMQVVKRKAMAAGGPPNPATMKMLGQIALASSVFAVVMAVVTFA